MIINENGWGNKPQEETKESVKSKKIKQLNEGAELDAGEEDAKQE